MVGNDHSTKLNSVITLMTDIISLLIMLIGLLRLGFHESGVRGLGHLMWTQVRVCPCYWLRCFLFADHDLLPFYKGLVWLFFSTIAYVPPVVSGADWVYLFL